MTNYNIDYDVLEGLLSLQCTLEEVAAFFKLPISVIRRLAAEDPKFKEIYERGHSMARVSLRRLQWRHATGRGPAAVAMTIHLSKHWLGETDKSTLEVQGSIKFENGESAADKILRGLNASLLTPDEKLELVDLCDEIDEKGLLALSPANQERFWQIVRKSGGTEIMDITPVDEAQVLLLPAPSENKTGTDE